MKNSRLKSFFLSGIQAISVQVLAIVFFLIISLVLPKDEFGIISWANATSVFITTLLSFGFDQIVVRRIAASKSSEWAAAAYLLHALIGSVLAFLVLTGFCFLSNVGSATDLYFLPWFFLAQSLTYLGTPLKLFLNAKRIFTPYAIIALISNIIKILAAFIMVKKNALSISSVYSILIVCSLIEFVSLLVYVRFKEHLSFKFKLTAYYKLVKESVPQYVSVLFDSGLSRADWILLGIISTNAITAEYSFAYRAFEISRLPITVVAPIILNIFAKMLLNNIRPDAKKQIAIRNIYSLEAFGATLIPLCLNILWSPVIDAVSKEKYGSTNAMEFLVLSICIPFMFVINLFWTLCFAGKKYKQLSAITLVTAVLNLVLNIALIPFYGGLGAAMSFLVTTVVQLVLYFMLVKRLVMSFSPLPIIIFMILAALSYFVSLQLASNVVLQLLIAVTIYCISSLVTGSIKKQHLQTLQLLLKR